MVTEESWKYYLNRNGYYYFKSVDRTIRVKATGLNAVMKNAKYNDLFELTYD